MNEIIELTNMSRRKFFKKSAKKILYGDWINQILAFLIVGACFIGITNFGSNLALLIHSLTDSMALYGLVSSVFALMSFFFVLPLVFGLVCFEIKAVENGRSDLKDIFFAFNGIDSFFDCFQMCISLVFRAVLCFAPAIALWCFTELVYTEGMFVFSYAFMGIDVVAFALRSMLVVFVYIGFLFFAKCIPALFVSVAKPHLSPRQAFLTAKVCMFDSPNELLLLLLSFVPLFVISLFSFGFLFVVYTFPYLLITLVLYSKYIYEKEQYIKKASAIIYTEENKNENNPKGSI